MLNLVAMLLLEEGVGIVDGTAKWSTTEAGSMGDFTEVGLWSLGRARWS